MWSEQYFSSLPILAIAFLQETMNVSHVVFKNISVNIQPNTIWQILTRLQTVKMLEISLYVTSVLKKILVLVELLNFTRFL